MPQPEAWKIGSKNSWQLMQGKRTRQLLPTEIPLMVSQLACKCTNPVRPSRWVGQDLSSANAPNVAGLLFMWCVLFLLSGVQHSLASFPEPSVQHWHSWKR